MYKIKLSLIHVILPLVIGGLIYVCFRSLSLRLFDWFEIIGLNSFLLSIRNLTYSFKTDLPLWVYFSLPDGLWVYSFSSALIIFWDNDFKKFKLWSLIPLVLSVLIEILQVFDFFPGTFDFIDLIFSIMGLLISKIIINHKLKLKDSKYIETKNREIKKLLKI